MQDAGRPESGQGKPHPLSAGHFITGEYRGRITDRIGNYLPEIARYAYDRRNRRKLTATMAPPLGSRR